MVNASLIGKRAFDPAAQKFVAPLRGGAPGLTSPRRKKRATGEPYFGRRYPAGHTINAPVCPLDACVKRLQTKPY